MRGDSGSASVYVLGALAFLTVIALPAVIVGVGFAAHRNAVQAADLSALGGAQTSLTNAEAACSMADEVAQANGARLQECSLSSEALTVEVAVVTSLPFLPTVSATSRAGQAPTR